MLYPLSSSHFFPGCRIALLTAKGLGDGLLALLLAKNFLTSGCLVTVYNTPLCLLQDWFPGISIRPQPEKEGDWKHTLALFDTIVASEYCFPPISTDIRVIFLLEKEFNNQKSMVENFQSFCQRCSLFHAPYNGISPPISLQWRKKNKRIILHPLSSKEEKNWPMPKYLSLAFLLEKKGFFPQFCLAPHEYPLWGKKIPSHFLPYFSSLSAMGSYIYESGFFIGNDSGLGHLASSLHIPTLSLFARKSYSHLWRPGWGRGKVVTPLPIIPGRRWKEKLWKTMLSVGKVYRSFEQLLKEKIPLPPFLVSF